MALHWDVSNVKDHLTVTTDPNDNTKWHPVTFTLAQATMIVGLGKLDESTIDEWTWRLAFLKRIDRADFLNEKQGKEWVSRSFKPEELRAHFGMRTNVSDMKRREWLALQLRILSSDTDRAVRNAAN